MSEAVVVVPDEFEFNLVDEIESRPEIVGRTCPEKLFDHHIQTGTDVAILTRDTAELPWLGRIVKTCNMIINLHLE